MMSHAVRCLFIFSLDVLPYKSLLHPISDPYIIDPLNSYTLSLNLELIDQPLKAADLDGMRRLPESVKRITAAD
jgi:hypothetical protein